jgi:hypothetical protein
MRVLSIIVLVLTQTAHTVAHSAEYPAYDVSYVGSVIDLSNYQQVWADEFDTLRISRPGRGWGPWFTGVHAVLVAGEKMAVNLPDPAYSLNSGVLSMSTRLDPVDSKRVEAHLQTHDERGHTVEFQNGYVEARIWIPGALGSHAGLWLLSIEKGLGHIEVDIVETYGVGDASVHFSTHVWPARPGKHQYNSKRAVRKEIFDDYHLYGLLATDEYFAFYYDQKEMARIARLPEQRVPMYLLLSVFGNPTQPIIEPATMKVDYVRIYAPKPTPNPPVLNVPGG